MDNMSFCLHQQYHCDENQNESTLHPSVYIISEHAAMKLLFHWPELTWYLLLHFLLWLIIASWIVSKSWESKISLPGLFLFLITSIVAQVTIISMPMTDNGRTAAMAAIYSTAKPEDFVVAKSGAAFRFVAVNRKWKNSIAVKVHHIPRVALQSSVQGSNIDGSSELAVIKSVVVKSVIIELHVMAMKEIMDS